MTVRFIDTNVLLYAISNDQTEIGKAKRANEILESRDLALSVQVLQEFYVQATRESRPDPLTHEQAVGLVESFPAIPDACQESVRTVRPLQRFDIPYGEYSFGARARRGTFT
jgi:predicted nucleic acid-binding protein